ncbi:DEAD/DEAH box helicase family protein [Chryseobacterium sp. EO14]|uniref:DEAD/DEAH box helicase family protein n=1 Tax=Chryseobacterium sp. EO14 TaxID=2950551 RepID=UPI00210DF09E|nr:DEAD/DEAH box helicase family protein [Chryseobacterium sp. EO14]MCQ4140427.1 DEAD/DEAH box helicase family protein [Chryseobacterium sp. EO14]
MNVNDHFNGFPIDYFTIEREYFLSPLGNINSQSANIALERDYDRISKDTLELSENGYIRDSLLQKLDLNTKDTTVINCAVGQGKTSSLLLNLNEHFDNNKNTYFIIAVPLVSLISQYQKDLIELGIHENEIFNYEKIGKSYEEGGLDYNDLRRRFHLVTVNTLLGNPGENAVLASQAKSKYLQEFTTRLKANHKTAVLVFDEIHEAISNFSKIGIIHLFYWKEIIKKTVILSATYNVASVSVIRLLSALTDHKINILESERIIKRPQSRLFLHFDNSEQYTADNITLNQLVDEIISQDKQLDIISFSKQLVKDILSAGGESQIGSKLRTKYGEIRDCTSNLYQNQNDSDEIPNNRFDNNFCNVGTNFKSGVSINKENHSLIIILPPTKARRTYKTMNGIFTEGVNSIIQALARQRNVGDIHIILPSPLNFDYGSITNMDNEQKEIFISAYNNISVSSNTIETSNNVIIEDNKLILFKDHFEIVRNKYEELANRLLSPILLAINYFEFIDFEEFVLQKSELTLVEKGFLGKDLSSFITYSAFTNQFYNARLAGTYLINAEITEESEFPNLFSLVYERYNTLEYNSGKNLKEKIEDLDKMILKASKNSFTQIQKRKFKKYIIDLISNSQNSSNETNKNSSFNYLISSISNNPQAQVQLKKYIDKLKSSVQRTENFEYLPKYNESQIFENERDEILKFVEKLKESDKNLNSRYLNFFRDINTENAGSKMFKFLRKEIFEIVRHQKRDMKKTIDYDKIIITRNVNI